LNKCKKCGEYNFEYKPCSCMPYQVFYEEYYGEERKTIYGFSHEDVVEKVAFLLNQDDPGFDTDIFETPIIVTDLNGAEKSFNCVATVDINYNVREIEI